MLVLLLVIDRVPAAMFEDENENGNEDEKEANAPEAYLRRFLAAA